MNKHLHLVFALFILSSFSIFAQTPVNNLCEDAIELVCGDTVTGTTAQSTSTGAPAAACGTTSGAPGNWYSFTGTGDIIDLSMCDSTFDTKIQVYSGDCSNLVCIGGDDDGCVGSTRSEFTFLSEAGTEYLIYTYGFNTSVGDYTLTLTCITPPPVPENDDCEGAIALTVNTDESCTEFTSATIAGATASNVTNTCPGVDDDDVWFSFVATETAHRVNLLNISGNTTDLVHGVYEGDCGTLTNISCSDPDDSVVQNLTVGTTYFVQVYTFNATPLNDTTFDICISILPDAPENDDCENAVELPVNIANSCVVNASGTLESATPSPQGNTCGGDDDDDVWYQFDAIAASHFITFYNVTGPTTNLNFVLYEGADCDNLTQLFCFSDNSGTATGLTPGDTYYLRVYSDNSVAGQNIDFDVCITTPSATDCSDAQPFCSQEGLIFNNTVGGLGAPTGIDYDCLASQPDPTWFYLQIQEDGDLDFLIVQDTEFDADGNPVGDELDVDFIAWGPFDSPETGCENLNSTSQIDCSFSADAVETFSIPNAMAGEFYILLITNYSEDPGFISLQQTNFGEPGGGSTNCDIVCDVTINEGDVFLCDEDEFTLTTSAPAGVTSYQWYFNGAILFGEIESSLTVTETGEYRVVINSANCDEPGEDTVTVTFLESPDCSIEPDCSTLVFLEDFGQGTERVCFLTGVSTTYACNTTSQIEDGEYTVFNSSDGLNTGWHPDMEDHSEDDSGDGRMLFVNADFTSGEFYRRTIAVDANEDYALNTWITSVYDTDSPICPDGGIPINVILRIEDPAGNLVVESSTGTIANGPDVNWQEYFINFNSQNFSSLQLVLINNSDGGCGNDLAIDDISLSLVEPQPMIVDPVDLGMCDVDNDGVEIFNLEDQIDEILDGQDPTLFNVSFHLSQFEAEANTNAITTPAAYANTSNPETIFVRVEKEEQPTCFSTVDFILTVTEVIDIMTNLPPDLTFCSTDDFTPLDATPTNAGIDLTEVTYVWTNDNGDTVSTDAIFTPTEAGTYTVVVTLPPCSEATFVVAITVQDAPVLDLGADEIICDGESFEIVPQITGDTTGIVYEWNTGATTPTLIVDETGTYDLTITVGACSVTDSIDVLIRDPLIVDVGEDFKVCREDPNTITATTSEENVTYQWFLNGTELNGETDSTLTFTVPATEFGSLTYTVLISDGDCTGTDSVDILMYDIDNCVITEGISPNGDGKNDCLDLEFLDDRQGAFSIEIFNRHGRSLFKQNNYVNEWCGQSSEGDALPTGTYYYVLKFATPDPEFGDVITGWVYLNTVPN